MNKLEVGIYVRTDKGLIGKVTKKEQYDTHCILEYTGQYCKRILSTSGNDSEVIKSSYNIIDLIEVGDYVNGVKVDNIILKDDKEICFRYKYAFEKEDVYTLHLEDIKSIVTKEKFESMEYEVSNE